MQRLSKKWKDEQNAIASKRHPELFPPRLRREACLALICPHDPKGDRYVKRECRYCGKAEWSR